MSHNRCETYKVDSNIKPEYDNVIQKIANYALSDIQFAEETLNTAFICLMDSLGCGFRALQFKECIRQLGPLFNGLPFKNGSRVPGTEYVLDPVKAAWDIGCIIRWLDFNDTWLAAEWGHPSDNIGGILACADYISIERKKLGKPALQVRDILKLIIKAHEIQGILALENSFNKIGLDHVILVKVATVAAVSVLFNASKKQMLSALSHAFVDGQSLRTYRHAPNTGSRKSWAAGDATSRAVRLVDIVMRGEIGIPSVLTAKKWGFYDVSFHGKPFKFQRDFGDYVMQNILFKVSYPAEFHAQTAVECAVMLNNEIVSKIDDIDYIELTTHESAIRIISKEGPLTNAADRDHCLQYMVAVALLFGDLSEQHYSDKFHAANSNIDVLRSKMKVKENLFFTEDYHNPDKRSIANSVQVFYKDGTATELKTVEYPLGHCKRRQEALPRLQEKFKNSVHNHFSQIQSEQILLMFVDKNKTLNMSVDDFVSKMIPS